MDILQISLFFVVSYILSRVFVTLRVPELVVGYLFEKKHVSIQKLTFIFLMSSTLLSAVIANLITVLTLMPLVLILQSQAMKKDVETRKINTLFLLTIIWGANIGGIGLVTGTTTNGILLGLYEVYKMPISHSMTFVSWMAWGLPLVVILAVIGWAILMLVFRPGNLTREVDFSEKVKHEDVSRKLQRIGFFYAGIFVISASLLSYLLHAIPEHQFLIMGITIVWTGIFVYLTLFREYRIESGEMRQLLKFKDTLHDIPKKGILWIAIGLAVTLVLWRLNFHQALAHWLSDQLQGKHSVFWVYLLFALFTTFATEIISNSAVQVATFMVLFPMTRYNPDLSWQGMLIIALCSSCAFMTPMATPSNGLGFGSSAKVSLKHMLSAGFLMNIACSVIISLWVFYVVPVILALVV